MHYIAENKSNLSSEMPTIDRACLSQLLPYDPGVKKGVRLKDGLKEFHLLLTLAQGSIESFQKGTLKDFDPLVGENACQIRAIKIALITLHQTIDVRRLHDELAYSKFRVEQLLTTITNFGAIEESLKDYLEKENLDICLNEDEKFLVKSYVLSKTKVEKPFNLEKPLVENASTDAKRIKAIGNVGTSFSWDFVKHLREKLSANSVNFVQKTAVQLNGCLDTSRLSDKYSILHNGLTCIPYYWTARVLLEQALISRIPIVMIIEQRAKDMDYGTLHKMALYYDATESGYKRTTRCSLDESKPALVLLASTCRNSHELPTPEEWEKELLNYCPIDLILAYSASHRQYPDESKESLIDASSDHNYTYHLNKAQEWGCTLNNPALFFLSHAYCERITNVVTTF